MSDNNEEPMPVVIEGDKNVRDKIDQWLRSSQIDFNYKITTNFFTGEKENHSDVIDLWKEDYETSENKNKFKIMKITRQNKLKHQNVSGIKGTSKSGKRIEVFLLCFNTSDDEITYGCISGNVSITSENKEIVEKIRGHPEELASVIFSKSNPKYNKINIPINFNPEQVLKLREANPNYEYQKTVNNFVSDPEVHEAIIENWIEEYDKNIKNSLE
ncbi:10356_t:CDS:2, partial [Scutellospora calospora]